MPIFFSLLGGLVGYYANKDKDKEKAKNILYVGIALFVMTLGFQVFAAGTGIGVLSLFSPLSFLVQ